MKNIFAKPYKVIVESDGVSNEIPVHNAEGIFKSVELDKLNEESIKVLSEHNEVMLKYSMIQESVKDKTIGELTEEERDIYISLESSNKKMRETSLKFVMASVKEAEKYASIIDEILPSEMQTFISCIKTAGFGGSTILDESSKKKEQSTMNTKKSNSEKKVIRRKK